MKQSFVELARKGDLAAICDLMDLDSSSSADRDVYKWLCAAEDFGHDADDAIEDVLEVSSLRYDDDGYVQAAAHWELARAYLLGDEGLPVDLTLAEKHLEAGVAEYTVEEINAGTGQSYDVNAVYEQLSGKAKALLKLYLE